MTAEDIVKKVHPSEYIALQNLAIQKIKQRAINSFYFFCTQVAGYNLLSEKYHKPICDSIQEKNPDYFLFAFPKTMYKSTIATICYPLWHLLCRDPNERFLIESKILDNGLGILRVHKDHLTRNPLIVRAWGNQLTKRWNSTEIDIALRSDFSHREPNIEVMGIYNQVTSKHPGFIICDDIVTVDDLISDAEREHTKQAFRAINATVMEIIGQQKTKMWIVNTRWTKDDAIEDLEGDSSYFKIVASLEHETIAGKSNFPELISDEMLANIKSKVGALMFEAVYNNKPTISMNRMFPESSLKFFSMEDVDFSDMRKFKYCDPAWGTSKRNCFSPIFSCAYDAVDDLVYIYNVDMDQRSSPKLKEAIYLTLCDDPAMEFYGESNFHQHQFFSEEVGDYVEEKRKAGKMKVEYNYIGWLQDKDKDLRIRLHETQIKNKLRFRFDWKDNPHYKILMEHVTTYPANKWKDGIDGCEAVVGIALTMGQDGDVDEDKIEFIPKSVGRA